LALIYQLNNYIINLLVFV